MITLSESDHVYHVDGRSVPVSVTGLLKWAGLIDDRYFTEYARIRGKLTHLAIKYHNDGVLDEQALDVVLQPYFKAYIRFLVDSGFIVTGSEIPVYSEDWDYAGTADLFGVFKRSPICCIGDTKTGKMQAWTGIQTALYAIAQNKPHWRRFGVELRKNGTYKIAWFDIQRDIIQAKNILLSWRETTK